MSDQTKPNLWIPSHVFMLRSKLQNQYLKKPLFENQRAYKRQGNTCSNLLRRVKKEYFENLEVK